MAEPALVTRDDPRAITQFLLNGWVGVPDRRTYLRALVGIGACLVAPLLLARLLGRHRHRHSLHTVERQWARMLTKHLNVQLDVHGLEHIVPGTSYIVTPLHEGMADALAVLHLPLDLRFVARDELFGWPFFGGLLRDTEQISICPEQGAQSYLQLRRQVPPVLTGGKRVVVFPQGSILGIEIEFKRGPFALALAIDRPILPVAITGSHRIWEHPFSPRLLSPRLRYRQSCLPPTEPAASTSSAMQSSAS